MTVLRENRSGLGNGPDGSRMQVRGSLWPADAIATEITVPDLPCIVTDPEPSAQAQHMALQALIDLGTPLVDEPADELPSATRAATCTVTVFIPAHNEAASIGATLRSLREQTHPPRMSSSCATTAPTTRGYLRPARRHGIHHSRQYRAEGWRTQPGAPSLPADAGRQ